VPRKGKTRVFKLWQEQALVPLSALSFSQHETSSPLPWFCWPEAAGWTSGAGAGGVS
jgi:hypothetical protein